MQLVLAIYDFYIVQHESAIFLLINEFFSSSSDRTLICPYKGDG